MCEVRENPLGVDVATPRLEWRLTPTDPAGRGLVQRAYQIAVASSPELLGNDRADLWDSGKVVSDQTINIHYHGKPLVSDQMVWWKVRVWDGQDVASDWSAAASLQMGVLNTADWGAKWITSPPDRSGGVNGTSLVRGAFNVKPALKRATINICGLGQYDLRLNSHLVTADVLTPGWTAYEKTCLYDTYDVTALMREGANAVGVLLGNGMYRVAKGGRYAKFERTIGPLQVIARIRLEYADGSVDTIGTDERWRAGVSPMTFSSIYGGEDWDARLEAPGWDAPGFDDSQWQPAITTTGPGGQLRGVSRSAPPVRTFGTHEPVSVKEVAPNVWVYDLGQAASHMLRFTVKGAPGSVVKVTPSELLNPDGRVFRNNYNGKAWHQYTLAGRGGEAYTAKFHYGGNRYYQVECIPADGRTDVPKIESIHGLVVHSSVAPAGKFSCSNELFNRIERMVHWAEVSNMMSVISDCPHRERLGWLEQSHLHGPSFYYSYDMRPLAEKIIADMVEGQTETGLVPTHVPEYAKFPPRWRDAIEWGSASVQMPWQAYERSGDIEILRTNYPTMKRYVDYLTRRAKDGIAFKGLGDWSGRGPSKETAGELIATAIYYENVRVMSESAKLLSMPDDASAWDSLGETIRRSFNATFFRPDTSQYGTGSQGAAGLALAIGLVDEHNRRAVLDKLVADIEAGKYVLTVGEVCLPYLQRALADGGRSDVLYAMHNQDQHPGYGYQLKMGATALCETWDAYRDNSQIQFMLGHIMEWFYRDLAGIRPDPAAMGYRRIMIMPTVVGDLTEVKASHETVRGSVISEWRRDGKRLTMRVVIPPNVTAQIRVPTAEQTGVTEGGKPAADAAQIKFTKMDGPAAVYEVGSGDYTFQSILP
ncbi:MAG: family 78 glycoside hydrolase catalytic domain [Burkholderiales bacterium]|nr:family 78 glycoside hydrolase catalytic domain [Phycisphaerae bacterium]